MLPIDVSGASVAFDLTSLRWTFWSLSWLILACYCFQAAVVRMALGWDGPCSVPAASAGSFSMQPVGCEHEAVGRMVIGVYHCLMHVLCARMVSVSVPFSVKKSMFTLTQTLPHPIPCIQAEQI